MALRVLMLKKNLTDRQMELNHRNNVAEELVKREAEIESSINEVSNEEERSAVEESISKYEADKAENVTAIEALRAAIAKIEAELAEIEEITNNEPAVEDTEERKESKVMETAINNTAAEERAAFVNYIRTGRIDTRADYNMTAGNNGAIVPKSIAQQIVSRVQEISPIFERSTKYLVKGQLDIPVYPASSSHVINCAYATEFSDLAASTGDFTSVSLTGFLCGALGKISKSLINNAQVDVVPFVVEEMAKAFAAFLEEEAIYGTTNKITGFNAGIDSSMKVTGNITADNLIELQGKVPSAYQANACWIMNPAARNTVRKLKDTAGHYIVTTDMQKDGCGITLLGKPVYLSDNIEDGDVFYGDFSGVACKFSEDIDIEVLTEKFATQHAVGVVGWAECDVKLADKQKVAKLETASDAT